MTRRTLLASFASAAPAFAEVPKLQILILTGRDDHDWRGVTPLMRQYLNDTGRFEVRVTEEFRDAGSDAFQADDAAVLVYNDKDPKDALSARTKGALIAWVKSGKGLVICQHSAAGFKDWPEFAKLCGGNYYGKAQHCELHLQLPASQTGQTFFGGPFFFQFVHVEKVAREFHRPVGIGRRFHHLSRRQTHPAERL